MEIRPLTGAERKLIASWRYPNRYSTYDVEDVSILDEDHWAVTEAGRLFGYCCFGAPARVPGAQAQDGTLDIGYGAAPDLIGHGHGYGFVAAILDFAAERYAPKRFRLHILDWNERSRRVAEKHGFVAQSVLESGEGSFVIMIRRAEGRYEAVN